MRMAIVAGPPSTGKTSVLVHAIEALRARGAGTGATSESDAFPEPGAGPRVAVVKFDCFSSDDERRYREPGIEAETAISAGQCPDHFFASNVVAAFDWARGRGADLLVTESAGLCNRCSPYVDGVPAICVIDCLQGMNAPRKIGPLLKTADLVAVTKGDLVSQAEREVFSHRVQTLAPKATVVCVNGLTGQGSSEIAEFLARAPEVDTLVERTLRFSTPSALCSYCLGEKRLGEEHQMGNVRRAEFR